MLKHINIEGFKSLQNISVELPRLSVFFGPNAAGKSNFLDALHILSKLATQPTQNALSESARGRRLEQFSFPEGGLPELLRQEEAFFRIETTFGDKEGRQSPWKSEVEVHIIPGTGKEEVIWQPEQTVFTNRESGIWKGPVDEMGLWQIYYLEPWDAMRKPAEIKEVTNIGFRGENLIPFLNRLAKENNDSFRSVVRNLRTLVPSIDDVIVELDDKRGDLDLQIIEEGTPYSSRIISEGTLRILALCAIAFNPWGGSLVAFEEPENGVHPRRLENIANLLTYMAFEEDRQVIVTTHSPRFVSLMNRLARDNKDIGLFICRKEFRDTVIRPFQPVGPLDDDKEIMDALESDKEDRLFEAMLFRGWIDG